MKNSYLTDITPASADYAKLQSVRMIAFDLDGTLLTDKKEITDYTKEIIIQCAKKNIRIVPSTGRSIAGVPQNVRDLAGVEYMVTSNGARTVVQPGDRVVFNEAVEPQTVREILCLLEGYDAMVEVYVDGQGYYPRDKVDKIEAYTKDTAMAEYIRATRVPVDDIRSFFEEICCPQDKLHAIFYDKKERDEAWNRLKKIGGIELTSSMKTNIEINSEGVHKGKALTALGSILGIAPEEILAFGDGVNDIKMLQEAGVGVAMGNAADEVKKAADYVTFSNEENGVAAFIHKYVLSERKEEV